MKIVLIFGLLFTSYMLPAATFKADSSLTTSKVWVSSLTKTAECITKNDAFLKEMGSKVKFDYLDKGVTSATVESRLRADNQHISISTYKTSNPWSKTIAYTVYGQNEIYFNIWQSNKSTFNDKIQTVIHEWTHLVGFSHGDNSSVGKQNSVPYYAQKIALKYIAVCK